MRIDDQTKLVQVTNIFASYIDNDVVMANLQTGKYYGLNPMGACIWKLLEAPHSLNEMCLHLLEAFDIDEATCRQDVAELLEKLVDAQLVQPVDN